MVMAFHGSSGDRADHALAPVPGGALAERHRGRLPDRVRLAAARGVRLPRSYEAGGARGGVAGLTGVRIVVTRPQVYQPQLYNG
jgi:hypothetical protein